MLIISTISSTLIHNSETITLSPNGHRAHLASTLWAYVRVGQPNSAEADVVHTESAGPLTFHGPSALAAYFTVLGSVQTSFQWSCWPTTLLQEGLGVLALLRCLMRSNRLQLLFFLL